MKLDPPNRFTTVHEIRDIWSVIDKALGPTRHTWIIGPIRSTQMASSRNMTVETYRHREPLSRCFTPMRSLDGLVNHTSK